MSCKKARRTARTCCKAEAASCIKIDVFDDAGRQSQPPRLQTFFKRRQGIGLARRLNDEYAGRIYPQMDQSLK